MTVTAEFIGTRQTGIPGISDVELEVMLLGASDFLGSLDDPGDGTGPSLTLVESAQAMRALLTPAPPGGAGKVSAQRDTYKRQNGMHFMYMTPVGA